MSSPTPDQFEAFYKAATLAIAELELAERRVREPGYEPEKPPKAKEPFPWQERLATRVCGGNWPRAIALPTAAGKTACIDIAIFALACGASDFRQPRRIFFVVDRRIVVDQAWMHAKKLAKALRTAKSGILKQVADALRAIAEPGWHELSEKEQDEVRPLDVYALRGGMYRESAWARSPLQPTVIASTVDQVGSRLLFRGYGVSDSMKPVHAGLVGNDSLILLDEAHCAKPFDQTMRAVEQYRAWGEKNEATLRFVSITATPLGGLPESQIERAAVEDRAHPVLGARINASKPARLVVAEKAKGKTWKQWGKPLVEKLVEQAKELAGEFACVGIIVNRVATARELAKRLGAEAVLLTGRMRPLDRDRLFTERLQPLLSGASGEPPKFVVGTQCLECGADFDFHALVTECASLDALRQRFGRLNRVAARSSAKAVVVIRSDQTEPEEKETDRDPVYDNALANTWNWLNANAKDGVFDFGVSAVNEVLSGVSDEKLSELNAPSKDAPVLFPAHLDCWVQTHPIPTPDPDPSLFLHGPKQAGQPDVQVVFRADLGDNSDLWAEIVALCPPSSSEAVAVPIGVFKKWMTDELVTDDTADVEGGTPEEKDEREEEPTPGERIALRWKGGDSDQTLVLTVPSDEFVRPGNLFVVPCSAPGIEGLGDFPFGSVTDYAEEAFQCSRDKALLRLPDLVIPEDASKGEEIESATAAIERLRELPDGDLPDWQKRAADHFAEPKNLRRCEIERHPLGGFVITGKRRLGQFAPTYLDDSEPAESFRGVAVTLKDHSAGVAWHAERFAKVCGLDRMLFTQAGLWHDLGKLDPRFQAMLRQSSPRTAVGDPLAKSARSPRTEVERDEARQIHKYPKGARHELLSVALVTEKVGADKVNDLLLHLIATHHGSARPFTSPVDDSTDGIDTHRPFTPELFGETFPSTSYRQDIRTWNAELPERFWRVIRKYGWWGAAYHETVFRLADHTQSAAEQEDEVTPAPGVTAWVSTPTDTARPGAYPLPLTGFDGSNPLSFLAALGTLRLAEELFPGTMLKWQRVDLWRPTLMLPTATSPEEFVSRLHARVHCGIDPKAEEISEKRHKDYRQRKKTTELARQLVKDRKLRGKEREEAIAKEVSPLEIEEFAARREWLLALESAVPAPFLSLGKSIAVSQEEFAAFASRNAQRLHKIGSSERSNADFTTAFGNEACIDGNGRIIPTEFQLITGSGHQFFLDTFGALMQSVTPDRLQRALFGPWVYSDLRLSFRWDPIDDRRYAVSWEDPSSKEVRTEHGANLLAAFALPLFPVAPTRRGARTTGVNSDCEEATFTWPMWEDPRRVDSIRSLFQCHRLRTEKVKLSTSESYGVALLYRTRKFEVGSPPLSKLNLCTAVPV
ncbi:CRISPR-associated helicase Cas3, subtype Dpsyc OS=Thioflavicoccus mobilis 8321 GN=Thimo_1278 PE=4 SV=1 [Gemmata massiliana]|uniref:CRISPR-associated helicase Cas3, subtype Dpsyc n=1 Tax=Gemmata massiliana TaxID=1210884 RepID=A0A6P2DL87_9BACT|nr:type I-U CRISPR-associated helicase/endonuclease Cas3 [Gemmata massiliana]VTS01341.1 CRISPR-associated helicase Cas3, subtype Dpsyc OS=Thioflavicoccus mobilis 8321 GN=Thimo_1278 PE=4 SV=1 [Gemmata massiliana]